MDINVQIIKSNNLIQLLDFDSFWNFCSISMFETDRASVCSTVYWGEIYLS